MDNYKAEGKFCKGGKDCESSPISGMWSPIYDQSMNVELENGLRFIINFKYTLKNQHKDPSTQSSDSFSELKTGDYDKFNSICNETMIGFV